MNRYQNKGRILPLDKNGRDPGGGKKWKRNWCVPLFAILLGLAVGLPMAAAEDHIRLKQFQPPAGFDAEKEIPLAIRGKFDLSGEIFHIPPDGKSINVYDTVFRIAPGVDLTGLEVGMYVGLKLGSDREVVFIERLPRPSREVK